MMVYDVYQVDAFTRTKFAGNPTSIVLDARGLDDEQLLKITREMNNNESAFIIPEVTENYDYVVRYFTPTGETPICGHATIAVANVLAQEQHCENGLMRFKTKAGIIPVTINTADDGVTASMTQTSISFQQVLTGQLLDSLLSALGLTAADLVPGLPVQVVDTGHSKVMLPLRKREKLVGLTPNLAALIAISRATGCNGFYPFVVTTTQPALNVDGRMFAPISANDEDPVTGNANGALGAYLAEYGFGQGEETLTFTAHMGESLHRPGVVHVAVRSADGKPSAVTISGAAVTVFKTQLEL